MKTIENAIRLLREKAQGLDKACQDIDSAVHMEAFIAGGVELRVLAAEYRTAADMLAALEAKANPPTPAPPASEPRKKKAPRAEAAPPATVTPIADAPKRTRGRPRKTAVDGAALPVPADLTPPPAAARSPELFTSENGVNAPAGEA